MGNWTPTTGETAVIITTTVGANEVVRNVTIERVTKTKIVTTGGDFRIGRRGSFPDSFGPFAQSNNPWIRSGSLARGDSQAANDARGKLHKETVVSEAIDAGHRFANGIRFAKDSGGFITATIAELEAIRGRLEADES